MAPTRLIIELNRCFEPNAFNSGPPIWAPTPHLTSKIHAPSPRLAQFYPDDLDPLDLSASPASSLASSSPWLSLNDEEIKRIFSHPKYEYPSSHDQPSLQTTYTLPSQQSRCFAPWPRLKEELNPNAEPFVPSFASPRDSDSADVYNESPSFAYSDVSLPIDNAHPQYPPGLPHPLVNLPFRNSSNIAATEAIKRPAPLYMQLVIDALERKTTPREREVLMNYIVTNVANWDIESLLELAEQLSLEACNPGPDFNTAGQELYSCPSERYIPFDQKNGTGCTTYASESVAMVAEELHRQFLKLHGNDTAQCFAWNLREVVLMKFIQFWDSSKPGLISFQSMPSSRCVRSALALSRCIAELYKRNLISQSHISMCISLLLADLKSVEHLEALSIIVLGCGLSFWAPSTDSFPARPDGQILEDTLTLAKDNVWVNIRLSHHVRDFLVGLEVNVISRGLDEDRSVLGQSWGNGQVLARLGEISKNVRGWEAILLSQL